jgi:predicted nucleotidyltransferase
MGRLHDRFQELSDKLAHTAVAVFGTRLKAVAIFGSVGRGTPRFDSDCDALVVLTDIPAKRFERAALADQLERALSPTLESLHADGIATSLSLVIKSPDELLRGFPLLLDMVDDAKILYDPDNLLKDRLADLRQRLELKGARRIWRANAWHWDLKDGAFRP